MYPCERKQDYHAPENSRQLHSIGLASASMPHSEPSLSDVPSECRVPNEPGVQLSVSGVPSEPSI